MKRLTGQAPTSLDFAALLKQCLQDEAEKMLRDVKAREPYITADEADDYIGRRIVVPSSAIPMHKRADGVWVPKRVRVKP